MNLKVSAASTSCRNAVMRIKMSQASVKLREACHASKDLSLIPRTYVEKLDVLHRETLS